MKKGFTLMELLGVIVILGIISLIATTIVVEVVNSSKENLLFKSSGYYVDAVELSIKNIELSENIILTGTYSIMQDGNICLGTLTDNSCSEAILPVEATGDRPTKGHVVIYKNQLISISFNLKDVEIARSAEGEMVYKENIICTSVLESLTGNTPQGNLTPGDEYSCEVKPGTKYNFFVVSVDGDKVSLILDRNINSDGSLATKAIVKSSTNSIYSKEAWILKEDYIAEGGTTEDFGENGNHDKGPLTAIKFLKNATDDWINIPELNETYIDENIDYATQKPGETGYGSIKLTGRTRLPKYSEVHGYGKCLTKAEGLEQNGNEFGSCPLWLINYLRDSDHIVSDNKVSIYNMNGYWVISSYNGVSYMSWYVNYSGVINGDRASKNSFHGIRPVITLTKQNIG